MLAETRPAKVGRWTEAALRVLRERYLARDEGEVVETPEDMCWRVARAIAGAERRFGRSPAAIAAIAAAFYEVMVDGYFLPNSPTLMNAGKDNHLQYSACFVLPVGDSMPEIFDAVKAGAIIHQSGGGCVGAGAKVVTSDGPTPIEGLFARARAGAALPEVLSYDEKTLRMEWAPIRQAHKYEAPDIRLFDVALEGGIRVVTSHWHPFYVLDHRGITTRPAEALSAGDLVLSSTGSPLRSETVGPEVAWLHGLLLADGTFGVFRPTGAVRLRLTDPNRDLVTRAVHVLNDRYGTRITGRPSTDRRYRVPMWELASAHTAVAQLLHELDLPGPGPKASGIRVPRGIWSAAAEEQLAFIVGFSDGDGHFNRDKQALEICTISEAFADDLAYLACALGLRVRRRVKPVRAREHPLHEIIFSLAQCPALAAALARFSSHPARRHARGPCRHSSTPVRLPLELFRPLLDKAGYSTHGIRAWRTSTVVNGSPIFLQRWMLGATMSLPRALHLLDALAASPALDAEEHRLVEAYRAALPVVRRVTSVVPTDRVELYDLTVEGNENYLAGHGGAVLVHNTGYAFSRLRPKNDTVRSTGGRASGPVSFLRVFNSATEAVKQGGSRRGANMGILRVDHPDVLEFIECKLDGGITNFNISVAATDTFMDALARGEHYDLVNPRTGQVTGRLSAREVFDRIVRAAWQTGDPGMVFIDRINRSRANPTPDLAQIEATNPCITGDARLATDRGLLRMDDVVARFGAGGIATLVDDRLFPARFMVWEGTNNLPLASYGRSCLPISRAFSSGERATVTVRTKAGFELTCTPDHRVMTDRGWVPAGELRIGTDRAWVQSNPGVFASDPMLPFAVATEFKGGNGRTYRHDLPREWSRELGLALGWLVGDGWFRLGGRYSAVGFSFGPADDDMLGLIKGLMDGWYGRAASVRSRARGVRHVIYPSKFFAGFFRALGVQPVHAAEKVVPESLFAAPREAAVGFLQALFTADGTVRDNPQSNSSWIALTSKSRELLRGVQLLLLNLGIRSQILDRSRPAREGLFRYRAVDGSLRSYGSDGVLFELGIFGRSRDRFRQEVGFLNLKQGRLDRVRYQGFYRQRFSDLVIGVEAAGTRPVFDLTEPQSHSMIANGLVVHQCGEQPLLPYDACNLGSINVARCVRRLDDDRWAVDWDELERVVRLAVRFLDDVIEVNPYPLPEIDATVKANRRIGLGVMGWADLLFALGMPYDSEAALDLADRLMAFIEDKGHEQSARLAEERGPFPNFPRSIHREGRPLRNCTVTTIAPTGTISMIAGCSSGIEPVFALAFEHRVKGPDGERVLTFASHAFEELARAQGFWSEGLMAEVARRGSVQDIPGVEEAVRSVFKTAHEIDSVWHVRHQAAFQRHTDNGVSKTINLPHHATEADVAHAYLLAWREGCLGITVFRDGCKPSQVLTAGLRGESEPAASVTLAGERAVKPRPHSLPGQTYRMETPIGTAFVTVNDTDEGDPFEVFVQVGKAGSDTMAVAEALGRLVSLALRLPSPLSARRRLEEVINQLSRIGGGQPTGFGPSKVLSLPDALARVLGEHLGGADEAVAALAAARPARQIGDLCKECGQATLVYEEGCKKCLSCGFNEC